MKDTVQVKVSSLVVFVFVLLLVFGAGTVLYVSHVQKQTQAYTDQQNHRWCDTLNLLVPAYQKAAQGPATASTPLIKELAVDMADLSKSYGCS